MELDIPTKEYILSQLMQAVIPAANNYMERYGKLVDFKYQNGTFIAMVELCGLEGKPIGVSFSQIDIAEDGSEIRLGGYRSNMLFAERFLQDFGSKPIPIEPGFKRECLKALRTIF